MQGTGGDVDLKSHRAKPPQRFHRTTNRKTAFSAKVPEPGFERGIVKSRRGSFINICNNIERAPTMLKDLKRVSGYRSVEKLTDDLEVNGVVVQV